MCICFYLTKLIKYILNLKIILKGGPTTFSKGLKDFISFMKYFLSPQLLTKLIQQYRPTAVQLSLTDDGSTRDNTSATKQRLNLKRFNFVVAKYCLLVL